MNDKQEAPRRFGSYELVVELSRGVAGPLFLAASSAEDAGEVVVLRNVEPPPGAAPAVLVPLARAMRSAIGVEHPHVVPVVDVVAWNGRVGVVSARVDGVTLDTLGRLLLARKVASDIALAVRLARDALAALELLHATPSYVPGGLAPDALLVGFDGRARVLEPGLAAGYARIPGVAAPNERRAYLGPEQCAPEPHADSQSDLYAIGVMLWEMLQRRRLPSGAAGARAPATAGVPRLDAPGVSPALVEAVAMATSRQPHARFASASDMEGALAEALPAVATVEAVAATVGRLFANHSDTVRVRDAVARHAARRAAVAAPREPVPDSAPADAKPRADSEPAPDVEPTSGAPARPAPALPPPAPRHHQPAPPPRVHRPAPAVSAGDDASPSPSPAAGASDERDPLSDGASPPTAPRKPESRAPFDSVPPSVPRPQPVAPTRARHVGRCELFAEFAQGGMATVHLGRWVGAGGFAKTVAVKALHHKYAHDPEFVRMFLDEARVVARIRHPSVIATIDLVEDAGELFIVMDYVHGVTLAHLQRQMQRRKEHMPIGMAVRIMSDVLHGLHAVHEATDEQGQCMGVIHRDVSPENILVGADGHVRLIDFGIATALNKSAAIDPSELKGKLAYMAPEQVRGEAPNRQSDVFAATVVLWQILTGRRLFKGRSPAETAQRILDHPLVPPSTRRAGVEPALDAAVLRGLERARSARWPDAEQMADALGQCCKLPSHRDLADWVKSVAADRLEHAARMVALVENAPVAATEAELSQPLTIRTALAPVAPRRPLLTYDEALFTTEDPSFSEGSGEGPVVAVLPARRPRRSLWIAGVGAAFVAVGVLIAILASSGGGDAAPASPSARPDPTQTLPAGSAPSAGTTPVSSAPSRASASASTAAGAAESMSAPDASAPDASSAPSAPSPRSTRKVPWETPRPKVSAFVPRGI